MKFITKNLDKKLIIVLIILLLFNVVYPSMAYAVDFGGILLQPLYWLLLGVLIPNDLSMGLTIFLTNFATNDLNGVVQKIFDGDPNVGDEITYGKKLNEWFVGPDTIFTGRIPSLNANIFKAVNRVDILSKVTEIVAKFYVILRNIAAIVMLAGLIYTGINILINSNIPTKKTQYLMLLQDWLIGMVLLIFSHIIMILIFKISDTVVGALSSTIGQGSIKWTLIKQMGSSFDSTGQLTALILYFWINWLTIVFAIAYFKRYFWTCILTVFAPVMCVMYIFGQQTKQIYGNWLKEYMLNAFVQPFHMIVYTVLIGVPLGISNTNGWDWGTRNGMELTYALMAMSMIRPAEKYLRRLFNMDKGIANMASYDSGKQTITDTAKAIGSAVKAAVAVGATVMTSGAAAGAMGALGSTGAAGALGEAGEVLGEAGEALDGAGDGLDQFGEVNPNLGNEEDGPLDIGNTWDNAQEYLQFQANNEGYDSVAALRAAYGDEGINEMLGAAGYTQNDLDDFSDGDIKALADGIKEGTEDSNEANLSRMENTDGLSQNNNEGRKRIFVEFG